MLERACETVAPSGDGAAAPESEPIESTDRSTTVVVLADDARRRREVVGLVERAGWLPLIPAVTADAVRIVRDAPPDLLVMVLSGRDGELDLLGDIRATVEGELVPIVCLLDRADRTLTIDAFGRRADDVVAGRIDDDELLARLRVRIERRPVPTTELLEDPVTGALTPRALVVQLSKEHERVARGGAPGALAFLSIDELPGITARRGSRARDEVLAQIVRLIKQDGRQLDFVGTRRGVVALLLPSTPTKGAQARFDRLARKIYDHRFTVDGEEVALTPIIGYTESAADVTPKELEDRAWDAMAYQAAHLDLHPTRWVAAMSKGPTTATGFKRLFDRYRTVFQVTTQQLVVLVVPLVTYWLLDSIGLDITGIVYLGLVLALGVTATLIWGESHIALEPTVPPDPPDHPPPRASAIIAAYLPNEAGTVIETVEAFLRQDYPDLEVILAYNTPTELAVEAELREIAARDPRFLPLRVEGSVSKAQNVNAALAHVTGEFLGLFDADHHPAPGSFHRAWRWIADGAGVVQGHCVIRNGDTNLVTRLVATEFEAIYAVSHPGRARLHGFGIFGGSNGYWRTSLLHRTRMRGSMLTEDIDSSMRVVQSGEIIISDPGLVSTELAPDTAAALWNQRLRWAQGWSQVSLRHLMEMTRKAPTMRQRMGVLYLLGWREIYPWISLQMFPLLAFWWLQGEPAIHWFVPIFVFTTVLTFSAGPAQIWYSWRLAHPSIKQHKRWFVGFLVASLLFYTELKNIVARTAHLKELMRERKWKVTPRTGSVALDAEEAQQELTRTPPPIDDVDRSPEEPARPTLVAAGRTAPARPLTQAEQAEQVERAEPVASPEPTTRPEPPGRAAPDEPPRPARPRHAPASPTGTASDTVPDTVVPDTLPDTVSDTVVPDTLPDTVPNTVQEVVRDDGSETGPDAGLDVDETTARPRTGRGAPARTRRHRAVRRPARPPRGRTAPVPRPEVTVYDVEREVTVYDVELESADGDTATAPEDQLTPGRGTGRPDGASPPGVGTPARRPMIAGVEGGLLPPVDTKPPAGPTRRPSRHGPLLGDVISPGELRRDDVRELTLGEPVDLEALRPRRGAADDAHLSGS